MQLLSPKYLVLILALMAGVTSYGQTSQELLNKGWQELVRDNDTTALKYFGQAYIEAVKHDATEQKALALLNMGFCSYGVSYSKGLSFGSRAMDEYKKLEKSEPAKALEGRSRCLQLISTIKARQGLYREAINISTEAMQGFSGGNDTTGSLGLIYNNIGSAYHHLGKEDSSEYFHRLALEEHMRSQNTTYLPSAYIKVGGHRTRKEQQRKKPLFIFSCYASCG
jgi:tetratricopeptide (TPR) repeat protein